jgi:hypothetical protein
LLRIDWSIDLAFNDDSKGRSRRYLDLDVELKTPVFLPGLFGNTLGGTTWVLISAEPAGQTHPKRLAQSSTKAFRNISEFLRSLGTEILERCVFTVRLRRSEAEKYIIRQIVCVEHDEE